MKKLQILGSGCSKCLKLTELTKEAADSLGISYQLEKVTQIQDIMKYGVMSTPALVVDGQVKFAGKIPTMDEIKRMLT